MHLEFLNAPEDVSLEAFATYLTAVRDRTKATFADMLGAYQTFKKIRESFGLPVVGTSGEARLRVGALTDSEYEQMLELASMTDISVRAIDDALASKRKVGYDRATGDLQIERLPSDPVRIEVRNGRPTVISNATNQPEQITGSLGLAPIIWVGLGIAGVIVTVGAIYTVNNAMESATTIVQSHTQKTISNSADQLVQQGKATPAEAEKLKRATYEAAADLAEAQGSSAAKTGLTPDTNKTIRTVAFVALGAGVIYLIAKFVPDRMSPRIIPA